LAAAISLQLLYSDRYVQMGVKDDGRLILHELRHGGYDPTWERVDMAPALTATLADSDTALSQSLRGGGGCALGCLAFW